MLRIRFIDGSTVDFDANAGIGNAEHFDIWKDDQLVHTLSYWTYCELIENGEVKQSCASELYDGKLAIRIDLRHEEYARDRMLKEPL